MVKWLCTDAPQHAYHDWIEVVTKTVARNTHQEQAINTEIAKTQFLVCSINSGTQLSVGEEKFPK